MHSENVQRIVNVIASANAIRNALRKWAANAKVTGLLGGIGALEYNFVPHAGGQMIQPHGHLGLLVDGDLETRKALLRELRWLCATYMASLGGDPEAPKESLEGLTQYLRKEPVGGSDTDPQPEEVLEEWKWNLHDRLLKHVETRIGQTACCAFTVGCLTPGGFNESQRFLRHESERPSGMLGRLRTGPKKPIVLVRARQVLVKMCPKCRLGPRRLIRFGHTKDGRQRFKCTCCGKTFTDLHVKPRRTGFIPNTLIRLSHASKWRRWHRQGASIRRIAKHVGRSFSTVKKAIDYCEARWPIQTIGAGV